MIDGIQVVGTLAAIASVTSFLPQAWKIVRTRDVEGLSPYMYALTVSAFALWLTFGVLKNEWALMVPNALCLAASAFIFIMIVLPASKREAVADTVEQAVEAGTP